MSPKYTMPEDMTPKNRDAYDKISSVMVGLLQDGWTIVELNGLLMGMCRSSLEDVVGVEQAAQWDKEAREKIGWPV